MTPDHHHRSTKQRGPSRARLILPVALAGVLIAMLGLALHRPRQRHTVSQVARTIRSIALAGGAPNATHDAGEIGPWRIGATDIDPMTGEYTNFTLASGQMMLGAKRAKLLIDADHDAFSFELWEVSFTRVPDDEEIPKDEAPSFVHTMDHYIIGPAPYGADIIPDAASARDLIPPRDQTSNNVVSAEPATR
jgi:hypothetical protein